MAYRALKDPLGRAGEWTSSFPQRGRPQRGEREEKKQEEGGLTLTQVPFGRPSAAESKGEQEEETDEEEAEETPKRARLPRGLLLGRDFLCRLGEVVTVEDEEKEREKGRQEERKKR